MGHSMDNSAYGLWGLVIVNSFIFIFFAFSFFKPQSKTDWRTLGGFSAFILALFVEMYGFPLSIYFMSGWLAKHYPQVDFLSHENGHLLHTLLGIRGDPHFDILHILSNVIIVVGFIVLSSAWRVLYKAQRTKTLATSGPYSYIRHPQYAAFSLIMFGFLIQWPTIPTLIMFPILVFMYVRLSLKEEDLAKKEFGDAYRKYSEETPRFLPKLGTLLGKKKPPVSGNLN